MLELPPPSIFGLPDGFTSWRPNQYEAADAIVQSPVRFDAVVAPTGFGKSPLYIAAAKMLSLVFDAPRVHRTVVLTSTKGLERQLVEDFASCGLVDVRGQNNYRCELLYERGERGQCDAGPCHFGVGCEYRSGGCGHFDDVRIAARSELVGTNYAYWLAANEYTDVEDTIGTFDLLICDEAHSAPEHLADFLSQTFTVEEVERLLSARFPQRNPEAWKLWASGLLGRCDMAIAARKSELESGRGGKATGRELRLLKGLKTKLSLVAGIRDLDNWVVDKHPTDRGSEVISPVWPSDYREVLFRNVPKVVMVSATVRPKTLDLLGIGEDERVIREYPSSFDPAKRPVIYVPTVAQRYEPDEERRIMQWKQWVRRVDQIIGRRLDRKGLIHTVSYARAKFLVEQSRYAEHMLLNETRTTQITVEKFKDADPPSILVSPSVTTGYDFPADECRYQIIIKVPYPDTRSAVMKARTSKKSDLGDDRYGSYIAMQEIVQASGRPVRSETDWAETFILDDAWKWFPWVNRDFAPEWFLDALQESKILPAPPDLEEGP